MHFGDLIVIIIIYVNTKRIKRIIFCWLHGVLLDQKNIFYISIHMQKPYYNSIKKY